MNPPRSLRRLQRFAVTLLLVSLATLGGAQETPPSFAGHWEGRIALPGREVVLHLDLEPDGESWRGTIAFPGRGVFDVPVVGLEVDALEVRFAVGGGSSGPRFEGALDEGGIDGTFRQGDVAANFHLGREALPRITRPQDPVPPFPYEEEEVVIAGAAGHLTGTLTLPRGSGPFPAAVLLSGSGPQDRDYDVFGHRPFLVLADALTRAGIAVLRLDDRGVGGSAGDSSEATLDDLAGDALAAVSFLADDSRIDSQAVGLVGHSEGAMVAPLAASRVGADGVAFVVLLSAPGVPLRDSMPAQVERAARAQGASDADVARRLELVARRLDLLSSAGDVEEELREVFRQEIEGSPGAAQLSPEAIEEMVARNVTSTLTRRSRSLIGHDPRPVLAALGMPVLAVYGSRDEQVGPVAGFAATAAALAKSASDDLALRLVPGLNHFLQTVPGPSSVPIGRIEETLSPRVLELVSEWLVEHFRGPSPESSAEQGSKPSQASDREPSGPLDGA